MGGLTLKPMIFQKSNSKFNGLKFILILKVTQNSINPLKFSKSHAFPPLSSQRLRALCSRNTSENHPKGVNPRRSSKLWLFVCWLAAMCYHSSGVEKTYSPQMTTDYKNLDNLALLLWVGGTLSSNAIFFNANMAMDNDHF